ncbi:hypothetical protein [Ureibacillus sp. GCM10028918]
MGKRDRIQFNFMFDGPCSKRVRKYGFLMLKRMKPISAQEECWKNWDIGN